MKEILKEFGGFIPFIIGVSLVTFGGIYAIDKSYNEGYKDGHEQAEFTNEAANFLQEMVESTVSERLKEEAAK